MELESGLREAVALASSGAMGALLVWGYQKSIKKERLVKLSRRLGTEVRGRGILRTSALRSSRNFVPPARTVVIR